MPSKKNEPSRKTVEKKKDKVIEDKTFGIKNKKGKKQQEFIKNVQQQVKGNKSARQLQLEQQKKTELEQAKQGQLEIQSLFKVVVEKPKIDPGIDPKSVYCPYFKHGICKKGDKCVYSHDINVTKKAEKKNMYFDVREGEKNQNSSEWDQNTLEDVVNQKHAATNSTRSETICKYFMQAVEEGKYGWFWNCPNNGNACLYKHALPKGYILKKDRVKTDSKESVLTIEELVEEERYNLGGELTPVNEETFKEWKKKIIERKRIELAKDQQKKKEEYSQGTITSKISGKEIFTFDPRLATLDDEEGEEGDTIDYKREEQIDDGSVVKDLNLEELSMWNKPVEQVATCLNPRDRTALGFLGNISDNQQGDEKPKDDDMLMDEELLEAEMKELGIS